MNNKFADYAFVFQREAEGGDGNVQIRRFPFVMAMAFPFSALFQNLDEASSFAGSTLDRTYCIPPEITEDVAVVECLLFFIYTGLVIDINTLTKGGTLSIFETLTHESVASPEFAFDIMVSVEIALDVVVRPAFAFDIMLRPDFALDITA